MSEEDLKEPVPANQIESADSGKDDVLSDEIPDLNSSSITGKILRWGAVGFLGVMGLTLLYFVNQPRPVKQQADSNKTIAPVVKENQPKDIDPPPEIEPIGVVKRGAGNNPQGATNNSQNYSPENTPVDWWERKKMAGAAAEGNRQSNAAPADKNESESRCDPLTGENCPKKNRLSESLESVSFKPSKATVAPDLNYMISSVRNINAVLDTAIDSSEPGLISATVTEDVYSDNNAVRLIERGSKIDGQYAGSVKNGYARLGVIWTRIRTPNIRINIDSLGSDALGRSGMNGYVDNKFWDRFGAAFMLSLVKDTSGYAQYRMSGANNQSYTQNTGTAVSNSVEKRIEADALIPPVLYKNQGDSIQVTIARDLDFSTVYSLKLKK